MPSERIAKDALVPPAMPVMVVAGTGGALLVVKVSAAVLAEQPLVLQACTAQL